MEQNNDFTVVLVTGGFDPIHSAHLDYFKAAKQLGHQLVVGINSDEWLTRKKGRPFLPLSERARIISELRDVDGYITFDDSDGTAKNAIKYCLENTFNNEKIIFAKGGDRTEDNCPELEVKDPRLEFRFGVGGYNKDVSSSLILKKWSNPVTEKTWGNYTVLYENKNHTKVKELVCNPKSKLSMQRHFDRRELWYFMEGVGYVETIVNGEKFRKGPFKQFDSIFIEYEEWHQLINEGNTPIKLIEIQYGRNCVEEDIERAKQS